MRVIGNYKYTEELKHVDAQLQKHGNFDMAERLWHPIYTDTVYGNNVRNV